MYQTQDTQTGTMIDQFHTREEALAAIRDYEAADRAEGTYTPDFYEIKSVPNKEEKKTAQ